MSGNGTGPAHAHTAARGNPASNVTPGSSGATTRFFWLAECHGCQNAVLLKTMDDDIKTAVRVWNRYANGGWRKH